MAPTPTLLELEVLLAFYAEAGVDAALSEEPVDRFALARDQMEARRQAAAAAETRGAEPPPPAARFERETPPQTPSIVPTAPSEGVVMAARQAAATAQTLDSLRATLAGFEGCNLRLTATNLVFSDGNPNARVMFVGEAPGFEEDLQGLPFVGRSGQLLDKMMAAIGLDRTSAYIANVIPWRPPGNRTPTPQETEICRPFIERQIALVDPDFLILLGGAASKQILRTEQGISKLRGRWRDYDTGKRQIRTLATLHPAYLLRTPAQKRYAWRDFLMLKAALAGRG
jgi:DNA polymerase